MIHGGEKTVKARHGIDVSVVQAIVEPMIRASEQRLREYITSQVSELPPLIKIEIDQRLATRIDEILKPFSSRAPERVPTIYPAPRSWRERVGLWLAGVRHE